MDNQALINELIKASSLKPDEGEIALRDATAFGKSVEEILASRNLSDEKAIAQAKSKVLGIPYKAVRLTDISSDLLQLIQEETARTYQVIPLEKDGDTLIVGMVHPDDEKAQQVLRFVAKQNKLNLGAYIVTPSDLDTVLHKYSPFESVYQEALRSLNLKPEDAQSPTKTIGLEEKAKGAVEDAPVIKIVASLLKEAVTKKASDLHIEPQRKRMRVRFRVDGRLQEAASMPLELHQPIISRVKIMSDLKIDETRIPQDGRFRTNIFGREIDFRVSTFPTPAGEKVALRVLDPETGLKSLDDLGVREQNKEMLLKNVRKPYGMVLLTGPTGSGKTTTIYALMQILNEETRNIVSLEDPVEYTMDGINQSQVKPEIRYTFASGLRQILRQDPDVIMVGEIRDKETAELAVHAALTGHIMLSTLHTNNSIGVIPRLVDMGVDSFLLPAALNLMVAQRLVSRLCQKCKKEEKASEQLSKIIDSQLPEALRAKYKKPYAVYRPGSCKECQNGITGRVALFEMFEMTPQLSQIISEGISETKISAEAKRQGMVSLRQDGIVKALDGLVSIEEVLRETAQ
ncbi:MAG: ATPase, T2SS/T4P/T4SS family [Candidatus Harrisonbacteria bacterium]|nr:ATPase, T2SS/T4P/T4SS family [Candidatus Harrisonbacteria bacterium]